MKGSIAFFDSGVGGLSVLSAVRKIAPHLSYLYFADNAKAPYGAMSPEEITSSALDAFLFLASFRPKKIVVACHTVSVTCLELLRKEIDIPIVSIFDGTMQALATLESPLHVVILGTERTIRSRVYQNALEARKFRVTPVACPSLVPLIEQGVFDGFLMETALRHDLEGLPKEKVDVVLLACTHYPLILPAIQKVLPSSALYLDGAIHVAKTTSWLQTDSLGGVYIYHTKESLSLVATAKRVLECPVQSHIVNIRNFAILPSGGS